MQEITLEELYGIMADKGLVAYDEFGDIMVNTTKSLIEILCIDLKNLGYKIIKT